MARGRLSLKYDLNKRQQAAYDKTVKQIHDRFGSYAQIAHHVFLNCEEHLTGEAFRTWFADRRVPTHIVFVLYEIMDFEIDPLTMCPWLAEHVTLKERTTV